MAFQMLHPSMISPKSYADIESMQPNCILVCSSVVEGKLGDKVAVASYKTNFQLEESILNVHIKES